MLRYVIASGMVLALSPAFSANFLPGSEVESLFDGASGYELKGKMKNKRNEWRFKEGGKLTIHPAKAKKNPKQGEWHVDGKGRLCYTIESENLRCRFIRNIDGKVTMFNNKGKQKIQFDDFRSR